MVFQSCTSSMAYLLNSLLSVFFPSYALGATKVVSSFSYDDEEEDFNNDDKFFPNEEEDEDDPWFPGDDENGDDDLYLGNDEDFNY